MDQREKLRGAQRAIAVMFFNLGFGWANWLARIPAVREHLRLDDLQLGLVLLAGGIGALVAFRMASGLIRRHGTRAAGTAGSAAYGLLMVLPAVAPSGISAAAGLFLAGWFNGLMDVALNAQAVEVEKELDRPILAALHGCFSLGGFFGVFVGAAFASYQVSPGLHLGVVAVLLLVTSLLAGRALLDDAPLEVDLVLPTRPPTALLVLGAVALCSSVGEGAMAEWTAIYLRDVLQTSMAVAAAGFAPFSLAMIAGRLFGDRLTHAVAPQKILTLCGLVAATSLALGLCTDVPALFVLSTLGVGAGLSLVIPVVLRTAVRMPGIKAPQALSVVASLSYGGYLLCPPLVGLVSHQVGLRRALGTVVLAALVLAVLARFVGRIRPPATPPAA